GQRRPADVGEAVRRLDAHVDVEAPAAGGLGPAHRAQLVQHLAHDVGDAADPGRRAVGHRVEVDAPLVGALDVAPAGAPGVELDRRHLDRPDHLGQLGHAQLVGVPAVAGEAQPDGLDPGRCAPGHALLVDLLALDPGGEAVQHAGPLAQRGDDAG